MAMPLFARCALLLAVMAVAVKAVDNPCNSGQTSCATAGRDGCYNSYDCNSFINNCCPALTGAPAITCPTFTKTFTTTTQTFTYQTCLQSTTPAIANTSIYNYCYSANNVQSGYSVMAMNWQCGSYSADTSIAMQQGNAPGGGLDAMAPRVAAWSVALVAVVVMALMRVVMV